MEIKMPVEKPSREKEPPKTVIRINTLDELQKSVVENENQLIAIFCRKGMRRCKRPVLYWEFEYRILTLFSSCTVLCTSILQYLGFSFYI